MRTIITARHCDIPEGLRERAAELMGRLVQIATRPQRAQVVFSAAHSRKIVEAKVSLPRGQVCVVSAEASDFRTALDRATDKLRRQLRKSGSRRERRPVEL